MTNPITAVYNEHTAAAGLNLKYEAEEISDWELFRSDVQHIIFGKWMKVAALGTLLFGIILACVCPSFAPTFLITLGCVGLTLTIGGVIAGIQNGEKNGGFQRGFVNYINDNWAFTLASELIIAMACFGISKAVAAIQNARAKKTYKFDPSMSPYEKGKLGEDYISDTRHLKKNTTAHKVGEKSRIPDFLDDKHNILIESKNVKKLGLTSQLKDYSSLAKQWKWKMEIYVRKDTVIRSSLQRFIEKNAIK